MIICLYVFLFGIMGTIDSINVSIGAEETPETPVLTAPAVTSNVNEEGMAVYTYATEINVINAKKPVLADYTNTETMLLIPDETAATSATTTTSPVDFEMAFDDFDYTIPATTTTAAPPADTAVPADTTVPPPETTTTTTTAATAATTATTTTTTTTAEIPLVQTEDVEDIEDDIDEDTTEDTEEPEDDVIPEDDEAETTTTAAETVPEETTAPATVAGPAETTQEEAPRENNEIFTVNAGGTIVTDTALNIVSAAVMAEISDVFDDEAIKAQAIAAYTYIKYYNMNGQNAYIAKATPSEKVRKLVSQVIGKAMYYNGSLIQSVYTASTAGRSATAKNVWGIDYPYLQGQDTSFIDKEYDINYGRKATFTADEMKKYVKDSTGIVLTGDPSQWFRIESYFDEIFVAQMSIGGYTSFNNGTRDVAITGRVFRETIMNYDIRSYCFTIDYDADSDSFTITTYGYGHCVGMSQHGANILASKYGYNYEQILKFYYQGIEIK